MRAKCYRLSAGRISRVMAMHLVRQVPKVIGIMYQNGKALVLQEK